MSFNFGNGFVLIFLCWFLMNKSGYGFCCDFVCKFIFWKIGFQLLIFLSVGFYNWVFLSISFNVYIYSCDDMSFVGSQIDYFGFLCYYDYRDVCCCFGYGK